MTALASALSLGKSATNVENCALDGILDLVHLARQTDGDSALEAELLALFDRQLAKLAARLTLTDLSNRARSDVAHRLRGSALAIGANRVAFAAEAFEKAVETLPDGEREPAELLSELSAAVGEVRAAIASLQG